MADKRDGEDRVVLRCEGKSLEIEEGCAPQVHQQGSSAQGGPSLGTSSNTRGDLPDARKKREGSAPRIFARSKSLAVGAVLAAVALAYCLVDFYRRLVTGEGSSVIESPPGDSGLTHSAPQNFVRPTPIAVGAVLAVAALAYCLMGFFCRGNLVRLHGHKEQLTKLLLRDNSGATDVLVRGGSGMTALVRKVCEDVHTREHFDTIAWISVPQKYDPELIREEILLQLLFKNAPFLDDFDADHQEVKYFTNSEHNKARYLIVIDNLVDPRTQKFFKKVSRSLETYKVIFLAKRNSLINTYGRQCVIYELEDLSVEEPLAHFCLKKSPSGDFSSPLKKVCKLALRMFGSLGGAIVLHLRNRKGRKLVLKDLSVDEPWAHFCLEKSPSSPLKEVCRLVLRKFGSLPGPIVLHLRNRKETSSILPWAPMFLPSFNLIQQVLEILSNNDRLFCLLYLNIFPENTEISCNRVHRLWAAEGFLPDLGEAEGFCKDLLHRKCIHPVEKRSDGELSTFRVDNIVREIIASLSPHYNLETITSQGSINWPESVRYPPIQGTIRNLNEERTDVSSSEDKTTTSEVLPLETSRTPSFPSKLKHSKVLDMTDAPFQIVPDGLFELTNLRYWIIRDTSIKVIPDSIGKLTCLEFLDAKHSLVTELPPQVARLKRIRQILMYHHKKDPLTGSYNLIGFKASCRVGGLKCLEKLCFVEADDNVLKDLGCLTKLRRLGITKLRKKHGEKLCNSLKELKELKSLNIHAFDEDEIIDLHVLSSPPRYLKHLYLHGRLEQLPDCISSLDCLTKIILRWSQLEGDLLATLGKLPNLVEMELRQAYDGELLDFKKGQFRKLKVLLLEELEGLRTMRLEKETLSCLEDLTISRCQWLEIIPSGIEHIPTIRKLAFFDMSREFYEKVRADHEKDGYAKFKHIPEVYFTRWRAGHWEPHQVETTDEAHHVKSTDEAYCSHQVEITDEAQQVKSTDGAHCSHQEMEKSSSYDYDVFLSFTRSDTRVNITNDLYTSMIKAGIRVYKDDGKLHTRDEIGGQLLQAIAQSKILIPIFSKGYAQSTWCLRELVKMVESKNKRKQKIIPIFDDIAPSEVHYQIKHYGKAILSHAKKKRFGDETIYKWKAALSEVGALMGWDLGCMQKRGKGEPVKEIVKHVLAELKTTYFEVSECLVKVDNQVDEIMRMIGAHNHETKIVGIHGIGGIGKTTLAKIVYNQLSNDFDNCCFLSNIRETEITCLQNQLISTILKRQWLDIHNIMEGKKVIEQSLHSKKVLLLLDDVDHASQLDALMQKYNWFGKGSKIIITTRDRKILKVPAIVDGTYELTGLDFEQSRQLFIKYAFRKDYPIVDYVFHLKRAVTICGGLPIALESLGSLLSGKSVEEWDTTLKELEEFPQEDVHRKLLISIEALNEEQTQDDGRIYSTGNWYETREATIGMQSCTSIGDFWRKSR